MMQLDATCSSRSSYSSNAGQDCWHLDFIDGTDDGVYNYIDYTGSSEAVDIYVLDTGVRCSHEEFDGLSCTHLDSSFGDSNIVHSHGTHVAGTIVGNTVGIAHDLDLYEYPVCTRCDGCSCYGQDIDDGFDAVISRLQSNSGRRSVINLSWGGFSSCGYASEFATIKSYNGIVVAAAGNSAYDACYFSPASCSDAIAVGAYGSSQSVAYFSNYGSCVDVYAPGQSIVSATHTSDTSYASWQGTSMASPVVAGLVANMLTVNSDLGLDELRTILSDWDNAVSLSSCPTGSDCNGFSESCTSVISQSGSAVSECDSGYSACSSDGCCVWDYYWNDGWCDCGECEDELDTGYTCSNCNDYWGNDCDYVKEQCGRYLYCTGTPNVVSYGDNGAVSIADENDDGSSSNNNNNNDDNTVLIVAIVVSLLVLIAIIGVVFIIRKRNIDKKYKSNLLANDAHTTPFIKMDEK